MKKENRTKYAKFLCELRAIKTEHLTINEKNRAIRSHLKSYIRLMESN